MFKSGFLNKQKSYLLFLLNLIRYQILFSILIFTVQFIAIYQEKNGIKENLFPPPATTFCTNLHIQLFIICIFILLKEKSSGLLTVLQISIINGGNHACPLISFLTCWTSTGCNGLFETPGLQGSKYFFSSYLAHGFVIKNYRILFYLFQNLYSIHTNTHQESIDLFLSVLYLMDKYQKKMSHYSYATIIDIKM